MAGTSNHVLAFSNPPARSPQMASSVVGIGELEINY
jgi:hypothetical protein